MINLKHLILESVTNTSEFKRWFGKSKVVDKNGKPLIVYHGTQKGGFSVFNTPTHFGNKSQVNTLLTHLDFARQHSTPFINPKLGNSDSVYPVYLKIENPLHIPDKGGDPLKWNETVQAAKDAGYDGLIYTNKYEGEGLSYVVFDPTQIKSAIGNRGTFNPNSPDITKEATTTEAISPEKSEYEKAAQSSEYKVISVYMDKKGVIYIDNRMSNKPPIAYEDIKAHLDLNYNNNEVRIFKDALHGNKIDSGTQQLISALLKKGVIDSSWKVTFSDYEGWHRGYGDYIYKMGEYEKLPPNFWARNRRVNLGENLILYHGTSDLELPTILKYGLRPLGTKHTVGGAETRMRVEDNKNILYLTGTFVDAFRFAQSKARSNMLRVDKKQYDYVQYYGWKDWFIKPVVLLVRLPDFTRLRSDDDRIIGLIKTKTDQLWKALDEPQKKIEQEKSVKWFSERGVNYEPERIESYLWAISDNGFETVLKHIDKSEWKNWKASLKSHNQVGYEGIIPPNYLTVVDLNKVVPVKRSS
jgi:hypothetical protein